MADSSLITWRGVRATITLAALLGLILITLPGCGKSGEAVDNSDPADATSKDDSPKTQTVEIKGHTFEMELALDDDSRTLGLSDRKEIAEDGGMLFVFPSQRRASFVMRRCYVPIDLVYLDDEGYIDTIHRMEVIEPVGGPLWENPRRGYPSAGEVLFVLEFAGGTLDKLDLRRGQKIELPYAELQSMAQ